MFHAHYIRRTALRSQLPWFHIWVFPHYNFPAASPAPQQFFWPECSVQARITQLGQWDVATVVHPVDIFLIFPCHVSQNLGRCLTSIICAASATFTLIVKLASASIVVFRLTSIMAGHDRMMRWLHSRKNSCWASAIHALQLEQRRKTPALVYGLLNRESTFLVRPATHKFRQCSNFVDNSVCVTSTTAYSFSLKHYQHLLQLTHKVGSIADTVGRAWTIGVCNSQRYLV